MKQTSKILSIAALFALGAISIGCSSLKDELDTTTPENTPEPVLKKTVTVTSTVGLDAPTKALTALGEKTFAADETIAVFYTNEGGDLVKTTYTFTSGDILEEGRKAAIIVSMTEPKADAPMKYIYPASMANDNGTVNYATLAAQDGTLATLAANYDLATYDGTLTGEAALPESVTLSNQLAIGEFTVKNWGGTGITTDLTAFTVTDGTNTYTVTPTGAAFASSPVYVAMQPVTDDKVLTFTATSATTSYFKAITGKALARNNMYPVNLRMNTLVDLSSIDVSGLPTEGSYPNHKYYQAADGEALTGTLPGEVELKVPAGATVTLAGMTHHAGEYYYGIQCLGTATLILAAGTANDLRHGHEYAYHGIILDCWSGDATLTIGGTGTLVASAGGDDAGIGGNNSDNHIVITGGTVTATGGPYGGPGIGASSNGYSGNITITGGTVTATGGYDSPGIGAGNIQSQCGTITFSGGTTVATGGSDGYGIGAGNINSSCGDISFTGSAYGCSVTANRGVQDGGGYWTIYIDGEEVYNISLLWTDPFVYPIP